MKNTLAIVITLSMAITFFTISTTNADTTKAHCFKAEELEIQAQLVDEDANTIRGKIDNILRAMLEESDQATILASGNLVIELGDQADKIEAKAYNIRRQAKAHQRKCEGN